MEDSILSIWESGSVFGLQHIAGAKASHRNVRRGITSKNRSHVGEQGDCISSLTLQKGVLGQPEDCPRLVADLQLEEMVSSVRPRARGPRNDPFTWSSGKLVNPKALIWASSHASGRYHGLLPVWDHHSRVHGFFALAELSQQLDPVVRSIAATWSSRRGAEGSSFQSSLFLPFCSAGGLPNRRTICRSTKARQVAVYADEAAYFVVGEPFRCTVASLPSSWSGSDSNQHLIRSRRFHSDKDHPRHAAIGISPQDQRMDLAGWGEGRP